jgi:O-antigen/teichoic acid export membrane protein
LGNSILLARLLEIEQRGIYAILVLTITLIVLIANFGIPDATIYLIGDKKFKQDLVISQGLFINLIFSVFMTLLSYAILYLGYLSKTNENVIYLIAFISIIPLALNTQIKLTFLGLKEIILYNKLMALDIIILTIWFIGFYVFSAKFDIYSATLAFVGSAFTIFIINFLILLRKVESLKNYFSRTLFMDFIKNGKQFFIVGIGSFLLQRINFKILEQVNGNKAVGQLAIASSFPNLFYIFPSQLATILYPYISNSKDNEANKTMLIVFFKSTLSICILIILVIAPFFGSLVTFVFGSQYTDLGLIGVILMISALITGCTNLLINYLSGIGRPELGSLLTIFNIIAIIIFGCLLIPVFGLVGAVISKLIVDIISFLILVYKFNKITNIRFSEYAIIDKSDVSIACLKVKEVVSRKLKLFN